MKRMISAICCLMLFLSAVCAQAEGGFRFSLFESKASLYGRYFRDVNYQSEDLAFISPDQSYEELSFSYGGESQYYYSSIKPDILVIDYGTADEYALFRIWIAHCTETPALKTHTVTVKAGGKSYAFDVKDVVEEELYDGRTHAETSLIMFNETSLGLMEVWTAAVEEGTPIVMRLEGENGSVEFTVPDAAAMTCAITYGAYVDAGGLAGVDSVTGTDVIVSQGDSMRDEGFLISGSPGLNGKTLYLPSAQCAVSFPPEYVFEVDKSTADPAYFEQFGIDANIIHQSLESLNDFYTIYSSSDPVYYNIQTMDAEDISYEDLTPEEEQVLIDGMKRVVDGTPMNIMSIGFIDAPHARLLKIKASIRQEDYSLAYTLQYQAIYGNRQVTLSAISDSGRFSSSMEKLCDAIASTIRFGSAAAENGTLLSAQKYIDLNDERAATFSIPALWYVEGREEEQGYVVTNLEPYGEAGGWLQYTCADLGQTLTDMGMSRQEIEEVLGGENLDIAYLGFIDGAGFHELIEKGFEKIGDYEYYCAEGFVQSSYAGVTLNLPMSAAMYLDRENVMMHVYTYLALDEENWNWYAADARAIIKSAQYNVAAWSAYGM